MDTDRIKRAVTVRRLRKSKRLYQRELAVSVHVSEQTVRNVELGEYAPGPDTLRRLARALGVAVSNLR